MISFLRAVTETYVNWRGNIPTIIFQNFYCQVTWDNAKPNTSNALNSWVYRIDPTPTLRPCNHHNRSTILYKAIHAFYTCSALNTSVCIHIWPVPCMHLKLQKKLSRQASAQHHPLSIQNCEYRMLVTSFVARVPIC